MRAVKVLMLATLFYASMAIMPSVQAQQWPSVYSESLTVSVAGFSSSYTVQVRLDGAVVGSINGGGSLMILADSRLNHLVEVEPVVNGMAGERFRATTTAWAVDAIYPLSSSNPIYSSFPEYQTTQQVIRNYTFNFNPEYYLDASSDLGTPTGGNNWYPAGSKVAVTVDDSVPMEGMWGYLGGRYAFSRWSGISGTQSMVTVNMDGPKIIRAKWMPDYTYPLLWIVGGVIIFLVVLSLLLFAFRRRPAPRYSERPQPRRLVTIREGTLRLEEKKALPARPASREVIELEEEPIELEEEPIE